MDRDIALLFATRSVRLFGYGFLAVALVVYLTAIGLSAEVGVLLALTLLTAPLAAVAARSRGGERAVDRRRPADKRCAPFRPRPGPMPASKD